jgi:hypothetical protein
MKRDVLRRGQGGGLTLGRSRRIESSCRAKTIEFCLLWWHTRISMKPHLAIPLCFSLAAAACGLGLAQSDRAEQLRQERIAKNGALFERSRPDIDRRTVENVWPNANGEIDLSRIVISDYVDIGDPTPEQRLGFLAKEADAVVQATTEQQSSFLTPRRTTVFSEWEVRVTNVFKNASSLPVQQGSLIRLVRPGGRLTWRGRTVFAREAEFPDYTLRRTYVFYLMAIPETESFRPANTFELSDGHVQYLTDPMKPIKMRSFCAELTPEQFLQAVQRTALH